MPIDATTYVSGNFLLELDGQPVGFLRSVEGGEPYVDVVNEPAGVGPITKHPGALSFAPITVSVGVGMDPLFFQWVEATLSRQAVRKSGAVVTASYDFQETSRLSFEDALITEVRFPKFDAASKEAGYMTVTFQPRVTKLTVSAPGARVPTPTLKQKTWISANFRLRIAGLESACAKVATIESILVSSTPVSDLGVSRIPATSTTLTVSKVVLTASETVAADFAAWFDDFAVRGNGGERTATIDLLTPDSSATLLTFSLFNVGIVRVKRERFDTIVDRTPRLTVELYCETITVALPVAPFAGIGSVVAPSTPVIKPLSAPSPVRPM